MFKYYNELTELLSPVFTELNIKKSDGDIFLKDNFAVKIDYNEENKVIILKAAKAEEGKELSFINLSEYLFTEEHTEKDLEAVAIDFEDCLRNELGAKRELKKSKIAMPTKAQAGETPTIEAFTKGFLDIFPVYRDAYRDIMAGVGTFTYVEFYKRYGIEKMLEIVNAEKNEKALNKYLAFLNKYFLDGDRAVISTITTVIFGGSFYSNRQLFETKVKPLMTDMKYLLPAAEESIDYVAKHKNIAGIFS